MRILAAAACLVLSLSAAAQERANAFHVFLANPSYAHSDRAGDSFTGAVGIAYSRVFARNWAAEIVVARETSRQGFTRYDHNGNIIEQQRWTSHSTPVDLAGFYNFPNTSSWKPYLGAVVRSVDSKVLYGIDGGVVWQFGKSVGLRFDGKVLGGDRPSWVDTLNASVGLAWRF